MLLASFLCPLKNATIATDVAQQCQKWHLPVLEKPRRDAGRSSNMKRPNNSSNLDVAICLQTSFRAWSRSAPQHNASLIVEQRQ